MGKGEENLIPIRELSTEEAKQRGSKGGKASVKARRKKKLMSQIYADFLIKKHKITYKDGKEETIEGEKLVEKVMAEILARSDNASTRIIKEIREGTEGSKMKVDGGVEVIYIDKCKENI